MTERNWTLWLRVAGDMAIAVLVYYAAFWLRMNVNIPFTEKLLPHLNFERLPNYWWDIALIQGAILYFAGGYDDEDPDAGLPIRPILAAVSLTSLIVIAIYFFMDVKFPRTVLLIFAALDLPALVLWQWLMSKLRVPPKRRRALLVGVNETSAALIREVRRRPWLGLDIIGLVEAEEAPVAVSSGGAPASSHAAQANPVESLPVLGNRNELTRLVAEHNIDHVILTPKPTWQDRLIDELGELKGRRARVSLVPSPFEIIIGKAQQRRVHDIPIIDFLREPMGNGGRAVKRAMDLFGAVLLALMVLPVLLATAAAIKIVAPGPIFFKQTRVGRNGKVFSIFKFRTMIVDAEKLTGAVLAQKDDPRIYPLGRFLRKTRIDELPQLLNILAGHMSFVGPRPERPEFVSQFRQEIPGYGERLRVKPGVTGLAQVSGFYETTAENKLKFDLAYIYNYSVVLDLKILLETVKVVLTGRGT
jgi:exopolysaccharide biosynthesis polyprenyl glycosylphosphotransferase